MKKKKEKIKGIGGWLILPTIGLILGAILMIYSTFIIFINIYKPGVETLFVIYGAYTFLIIYSLILEFQYKKEFKKMIIITLWAGILFTIIIGALTGDYSGLFTSMIVASIWTAYFLKSERVKNTFTK
ncbi:hypothetical protein DRN73_03225 [Candidatus Pacearchaeota archaeon]|nr:MAG: hypothetical protein DRN73_03225 [Candidatus Pacearchaeota archaeon]